MLDFTLLIFKFWGIFGEFYSFFLLNRMNILSCPKFAFSYFLKKAPRHLMFPEAWLVLIRVPCSHKGFYGVLWGLIDQSPQRYIKYHHD